MNLEIFAICDAAADYHTKTCIMGVFDVVWAKSAPASHPHLTVIARIRFTPSEQGNHKIKVLFIDADGKAIMQPLGSEFPVALAKNDRAKIGTFIFDINALTFPKFGEYRADLTADEHQLGAIPIYFEQSK